MFDALLEKWTGNEGERRALKTVKRLGQRPKLSSQDQEVLILARSRVNRLYTRRGVIAGLGILVIGGAGGAIIANNIDSDPYFEATYNQYLNDFETISKGDEEGEKYFSFFKERRKRGHILRGVIYADEPGHSGVNFYTAISDPKKDAAGFEQMAGFAVYRHTAEVSHLILKRVPIDPVWSGALIAHESVHVSQRLNGIEQGRPNGFILGEQEAYELEFRLIDRALGGRFMSTLKEQAREIRPNSYRGRLSTNNMNAISALFAPARSADEEGLRLPAYIIALNFASIEQRHQNLEDVKTEQVDYMQQVFDRKIPLIG